VPAVRPLHGATEYSRTVVLLHVRYGDTCSGIATGGPAARRCLCAEAATGVSFRRQGGKRTRPRTREKPRAPLCSTRKVSLYPFLPPLDTPCIGRGRTCVEGFLERSCCCVFRKKPELAVAQGLPVRCRGSGLCWK
jgi:hypothetical protein